MKLKRTLSLVLSLLMAFSLFAGIAPAAQADDVISDIIYDRFFQNGNIEKLFKPENIVQHGACGKGKDNNTSFSVQYDVYKISGQDVNALKDTELFQKLLERNPELDYLSLDPDETYYGIKIWGSGKMKDYSTGSLPEWTSKEFKLQDGTLVNMDEKLIAAYVEGANAEANRTGVTSVGQCAFWGLDMLSAVYLGKTVNRIQDRAFESTEKLAAINMPDELGNFPADTYTHPEKIISGKEEAVAAGEGIGRRAFYGCDKLTFWRAGPCTHCKSIGERAFYGNPLLTTIQFPGTLEAIGPMAFAWCRMLGDENFNFPPTLKTIGNGAFMFDTHMGRTNVINFPTSVTTIGEFAFLCCFGIGSGENDGLKFTPGGTSPLSIGRFAFAGCRELKTLKLDNRVTNIHTSAFGACERLENVVFGNDQSAKRVSIDGNAFTSAQSAYALAAQLIGATSETIGQFVPSSYKGTQDYSDFQTLTGMTPLTDAAFPNLPANNIKPASDANSSFPSDCIVHYPAASYNPTANAQWQGALDSGKTTWQGYRTEGDWSNQQHFHHFVVVRSFPATCTEDGMAVYQCTNPGCTLPSDGDLEHIKYEVTKPKLGHDYSGCEVKEPTCTEAGYRRGTCARANCGAQIDEVYPALGHSTFAMEEVRAATCTEPGLKVGKCIRCGQANQQAEIPALGHDWGEWTVVKAATATTEGLMQRVCKRDPNHIETQVIQPTGDPNPNPNPQPDPQPGSKCDGGASCPSKKFTDVDQTKWYHEAVDYAIVNNLFNGTSPTTFAPNDNMTRGMFVTVLYRMEKEPAVTGTTAFVDLRQNWYKNAVAWASENKIVNGIDATHFAPDNNVTREQAMTMLLRYAQFKGYDVTGRADLSAFSDASNVSSWAKDAMQWAVQLGLIQGVTPTTIVPRGNSTRAQIATILMRFQNKFA